MVSPSFSLLKIRRMPRGYGLPGTNAYTTRKAYGNTHSGRLLLFNFNYFNFTNQPVNLVLYLSNISFVL